MIISDLYEVFLIGVTTVSIICCAYTIYMIIYITPKSMSEYRYFLLLYTSWDLAFTVSLGIILEPRIFFPGRGGIVQGLSRDLYIFVKHNISPEHAYWAIRFGICTVVWSMVNIIMCQDYCLLYRFTVVLPDQRYHDILVNKKVVYCTVGVGFLVCFAFAIPFYLFMADESEIPTLMKEIEKVDNLTFIDIQRDSVSFWFNSNSEQFRYICFGIGGGIIGSEIFCYFCVYKILSILRANASSFSAKTYQMHRQMTILLYLQITNPFVFVLFPVLSCTGAMFANLYFHHWIGLWGLAFMNFYSISNTILTIIFVTPYRNFTKKYSFDIIMKLPFLKKYQTVHQVVHIDSSTGFTVNSQNAWRINNNQNL